MINHNSFLFFRVRLPSQIALDTKKESSINLLKLKQETATATGVNINDTNSDDDDEELVDESAQPISKEVFDWFQEHNLLKKVEEDQLHRMKVILLLPPVSLVIILFFSNISSRSLGE